MTLDDYMDSFADGGPVKPLSSNFDVLAELVAKDVQRHREERAQMTQPQKMELVKKDMVRNPDTYSVTEKAKAGLPLSEISKNQHIEPDFTDPITLTTYGFGTKAAQTGSKLANMALDAVSGTFKSAPLNSAYKYDPWAFKPKKSNWYRQVGEWWNIADNIALKPWKVEAALRVLKHIGAKR